METPVGRQCKRTASVTRMTSTAERAIAEPKKQATCFKIPTSGRVEVVAVERDSKHRTFRTPDLKNLLTREDGERCLYVNFVFNDEGMLDGSLPNRHTPGLRGDVYIEAHYEWEETRFDEDGDEYEDSHVEFVSVPQALLPICLEAMYKVVHMHFCPQTVAYQKVVTEAFQELVDMAADRRREAACMAINVLSEEDHPHLESVKMAPSFLNPEGTTFCIMRSKHACRHVVQKAVSQVNTVLATPVKPVLSFLDEMEDLPAPNLRCADLGQRLAPLYLRILEDFERRRETELVTARERAARLERAALIPEGGVTPRAVRRIDKIEKPLTEPGPSHRPPSRHHVARRPRGPDKELKIEAARQHEHELSEREEARLAELEARAQIVRIGRSIGGS